MEEKLEVKTRGGDNQLRRGRSLLAFLVSEGSSGGKSGRKVITPSRVSLGEFNRPTFGISFSPDQGSDVERTWGNNVLLKRSET